MKSTAGRLSTPAFLLRIVGLYLALSFAQRAVYLVWIGFSKHEFPDHFPLAFSKGLLFDLAAATFLFLPALLWFLIPRRFGERVWFRIPLLVLTLFPLGLVAACAVAELFFFDEFHARFNFIAVDYLIYTTEVIHNIVESYSLPVIVGGLLVPTLAVFWFLRLSIRRLDRLRTTPGALTLRIAALGVVMALCASFVAEDRLLDGETYWAREISKNSIFALFSAYRRNSINFHEFYAHLEPDEAFSSTRNWLARPDLPVEGNPTRGLVREIKPTSPEKRWNVVMVVMESMSADFLGHFGNPHSVTPNLDRLADQGLLFTSLYATGTRTVRGLEALMLSIPPTPGQSILRRPHSDHLFNLGSVFADHGYQTQFLYGGYGYFDNMKEWYESNGFEVVDRAVFPGSEIHFGNAWGVCDEDLFDQVLKQQDSLQAMGKAFFQVVMTTSNHRPYTYPDGRIDIPSYSGRGGAVKYSDYAIGKFVEDSKHKPWFNNTLFIFVADHDAAVAGGTDIPVHDFLIPAIFYNPSLVQPQKFTGLASQIDIAPTLLGMLNFTYQSRFFGQDLFREPSDRALLGTYQKVALLQPHTLTILAPGRSIETQQLDDKYNMLRTTSVVGQQASTLSPTSKLAIAIYQTASEEFTKGLLKLKPAPSSSSELGQQ